MNSGISDKKGFSGGSCSKEIGDMAPTVASDEQLTCTSPPKLLQFSDEEEESSEADAVARLSSLCLREVFDCEGAGGREDESSSAAERERPVSFWTRAMKSRACVWMTLGEWV